MGTGYTRQSSADIIDGLPITAAPLNNEFNLIKDAFDASIGHSHDGTTGEGPKIILTDATGVSGTLPIANGGTGATTASGARTSLGVDTALSLKQDILTNVDSVELGLNGTGDRVQNIDFHTSAAVADFNARFLRQAGTNGSWEFTQVGTGPINFTSSNGMNYNGSAIITAATIGSQNVANANTLGTRSPSTAATANTIAQRDSFGDIYAHSFVQGTYNVVDTNTIGTLTAGNANTLQNLAPTGAQTASTIAARDNTGRLLATAFIQNGNSVIDSSTIGSQSVANAGTLATRSPATAATANTIAQRDGSADLFATRFNSDVTQVQANSDTIFYSSTDNYIRKNNATGFRNSLGIITEAARLQIPTSLGSVGSFIVAKSTADGSVATGASGDISGSSLYNTNGSAPFNFGGAWRSLGNMLTIGATDTTPVYASLYYRYI